jgi:hypothetical protein
LDRPDRICGARTRNNYKNIDWSVNRSSRHSQSLRAEVCLRMLPALSSMAVPLFLGSARSICGSLQGEAA